jgi:hypothetical protein
MAESTPEGRAMQAAEALAAGGHQVSARAVRERAGVAMTVAAAVARAWNESAVAAPDAPELPSSLLTRFEAMWREAFLAARAEFEGERAAFREEAQTEVARLTEIVINIEHELDEQRTSSERSAAAAAQKLADVRDRLEAEVREQAALVVSERSRADKAEGALEAVTAERDRLLQEIAALRVDKAKTA